VSRRDDCVHSHPWLIPNASGALREAGGGLLSSWGAPIGLFGSLARGPRPPAEGSGETTVPTATPSYYPMPPESVVWLRQQKKSKDENQARTTFHRSKSNRLAARLREDRYTGSRIDSMIFDAFWPFNLGTPPVPWAFNAQGVPKAVPSFDLLYHGPVRGTEEAPKK